MRLARHSQKDQQGALDPDHVLIGKPTDHGIGLLMANGDQDIDYQVRNAKKPIFVAGRYARPNGFVRVRCW